MWNNSIDLTSSSLNNIVPTRDKEDTITSC